MKMPIDIWSYMYKKKKFVAFLFILVCFIANLVAEPELQSILPQLSGNSIQLLQNGEMVSGSTLNNGTITQFAPKNSKAYEQAQASQQKQNGFSLVSIRYIPYPDNLKDLTVPRRQLVLFNKIRALSTQIGITYISHRAGDKPKVLIEKCWYLADDTNLNNHLPDPVVTKLPLTAENFVYQKDSTFGGNRYDYRYANSEREIFVEIKNISALKVFGLFPAVSKGKLVMNLATYQLDEGILVFSLTTIEDKDPKISVLGYTVDLSSAFKRRITALQQWFEKQLYADEIK
ncbi:DUF6675 family protein [uncultured Sphaerochaeta sp.]|uniref:DUF6675 family protein n=1 Tax=uncultured Sphaerochaeta sp. TaxID=886478 RepID=UPI002A0A22C3|nr:DUF6675 family protein [uncultured Sphaerochaeta sp.]